MIASSNHKTNRIGTRTLRVVLALSAAAFVGSGVSYAKPKPPTLPTLNEAVCTAISGVWTANTCTIDSGTFGTVASSFTIGQGFRLDIKGGLTIPKGQTVASSGIIVVENEGGVVPTDGFDPWETGLLVYGTLANDGIITVKNTYEYPDPLPTCAELPCTCNDHGPLHCTEGITVSISVADVITPGTLVNSGTINIQNSARTRGIKIIGTLHNSASGAILVANSGSTSVGLYNRRQGVGYDVNGMVINDGSITIANSGDYFEPGTGDPNYEPVTNPPSPLNGYGLYNVGIITISAGGKFTINPNSGSDAAAGMYNAGSITSYGTFTNNRGDPQGSIWGCFNHTGTMINYGTTYTGFVDSSPVYTGQFFNNKTGTMINLGTIFNYGRMHDESYFGALMINYGTIHDFGFIDAGSERGVCTEETWTDTSVDPPVTHTGNGC